MNFKRFCIGLVTVAAICAVTGCNPPKNNVGSVQSTSKSQSSKDSTKNYCQFKDSDGNTSCRNIAMDGATLCEYHFKMLDDIYNDLLKGPFY